VQDEGECTILTERQASHSTAPPGNLCGFSWARHSPPWLSLAGHCRSSPTGTIFSLPSQIDNRSALIQYVLHIRFPWFRWAECRNLIHRSTSRSQSSFPLPPPSPPTTTPSSSKESTSVSSKNRISETLSSGRVHVFGQASLALRITTLAASWCCCGTSTSVDSSVTS
jgi:hypothetical protein